MAIQVNALLDRGGLRVGADGTFSVEWGKIKAGVAALTGEIMTIQATGDYAKARDLLSRMAVLRPEVQRAIDRLSDVPVDIEPRFTTAETLIRR
jgi:hypothetical protein